MYGTPLRKNVDKVKRRLVFESEQSIQSTKALQEDDSITQLTARMAQAYIEKATTVNIVFFLGYRHPHHTGADYYCRDCIEIELNYTIKDEDESKYISSGEKPLIQFTRDDHQDKSNYCARCEIPLYKLVDEQCRLLSPSSRRQRKLFNRRKRYGHRVGGISRSTKRRRN